MDVEATPANKADEVESTRTMIDRVERQTQLKPKRLLGDTAYGAAPLLNWIVNEKHIEPHIPVWEKGTQRSSRLQDDRLRQTRYCSELRTATAAAAR